MDYLFEISDIILTYEDGYVFEGLVRQWNLDISKTAVCNKDNTVVPIGPLYEGFYQIRFTVPNAVSTGNGVRVG